MCVNRGKIPSDFEREEGFRVLAGIYAKLGMKKEAVETAKRTLEDIGDKAHLRARLGFIYLEVGDKESAAEQYRILKERDDKAQDKDTKRLYKGWAGRCGEN